MTAFWLGAAALTLVALAILIVPLWRERSRGGSVAGSGVIAVLAIVPLAVGLYLSVTTFDPDAPATAASSEELALLEQLAARLSEQPNDVQGWRLLGRSYRELGDYGRARMAFEQAWTRTANPDDSLKISYAEALLFTEPTTAVGIAGDLVEDVLQSSPNNQRALFWGALVATERGQSGLAVERYTDLLATNPPPEIVQIIQQQLLALSGSAVVAAPEPVGPTIELDVSVGDQIDLSQFGPNARLYLLARSEEMPMPLAAQQRSLAELPGSFTLSDADNPMAAGRSLSQFDSVIVVARISASGVANEQSGDVFGQATVAPGTGDVIGLVIDQVVP